MFEGMNLRFYLMTRYWFLDTVDKTNKLRTINCKPYVCVCVCVFFDFRVWHTHVRVYMCAWNMYVFTCYASACIHSNLYMHFMCYACIHLYESACIFIMYMCMQNCVHVCEHMNLYSSV